MISEEEYLIDALNAVLPHLETLPEAVQHQIKLAVAVCQHHACAPKKQFEKAVGGSNWVVSRRTPRIVRQYGADVIALSQQKYTRAEVQAFENYVASDEFEGYLAHRVMRATGRAAEAELRGKVVSA